jgi:8-oxo-dGTP pyrophosphatase MutT (NUDIX family)
MLAGGRLLTRGTTSTTADLVKRISRALRSDEPIKVGEPNLAGVAVILGPREEPRILLIKRAERRGDTWSGQVAFPGGRVQSGDRTMRDTAARETSEEVGIDLAKDSEFLGYMGLFRARSREMRVVPSVFRAKRRVDISTDVEEVASHRWIPFTSFLSESSRSLHRVDLGGMKLTFPAFRVGDYLIWGLTERIISNLVGFL